MQYIQATGHSWTVYLDFLLSVIIKPFTAKHVDLFVYFSSWWGAKDVDLCGWDIFYILWFLCYVMLCYIIMLLLQASLLAISPIPYWTCRVVSKVQTRGARVLLLVGYSGQTVERFREFGRNIGHTEASRKPNRKCFSSGEPPFW